MALGGVVRTRSAASAGEAWFPDDERLPCDRLLSEVWERARTGRDRPDPHTEGCAYCREAVEGLTALDRATDTLRTRGPGVRALVDRVVAVVRAEVRLGRLLPLDDPAGHLRIAETTAAQALRRAADRVPGVLAAGCRLTPSTADTRVTVAMTLAVTLDRPLPGRTAQVRRAVADAAAHDLGLAVSAIDLSVTSEWQPRRPPDGAPGAGAGTGAGTGAGAVAGAEAGAGAGVRTGAGAGAEPGAGAETGARTGTWADAGADADTESGAGA